MSRAADFEFLNTDADALLTELTQKYEELTGLTVQPASPERLIINWAVAAWLQERTLTNWAANQNIPSRAEGENLDALAEIMCGLERPQAQSATATVRFTLSEAQSSAVLIPAGTRVTDSSKTLYWATEEAAYIDAGETEIELTVVCQTAGTVGNGWLAGQINTIVDLFNYYAGCESVTVSDGGSDAATDDEYYELLRAGMSAYTTAGPKGAYEYFAKKVSTEIADVAAVSPAPGEVAIYALMKDGSPAGDEIKSAILAACSADDVRPLTDYVYCADPEQVSFDIDLTYYISSDTTDAPATIEAAVQSAVEEYIEWQCGKMGRDINPSYLSGLLMQTGIKRVEIRAPVFTALVCGESGVQIAALGSSTVASGGYEDG